MKALSTITNILYKLALVLAALLLAVIVVTVFAQVVGRYVFSYGIRWSSELTVYCLTWMVFLACSCAYKNNEIVGLTLLTDRVPLRWNLILRLVTHLIIVAFMVITIYANHEIVQNGFNKVSSILKVPLGYIYISWSISAGIMTVYGLEKIILTMRSLVAGKDLWVNEDQTDPQV